MPVMLKMALLLQSKRFVHQICNFFVKKTSEKKFHVLRTDRRTRGEEERPPVHGQRCGLQPLMQQAGAGKNKSNTTTNSS